MMVKGARLVGFAVIGTVGLLLLAACGSSSSGPGGSSVDSSGTSSGEARQSPADPCSLLTIDQASGIIGEPAEPGHRIGAECRWDSTKGPGPYVRVALLSKTAYDGLAHRVPPQGVTQMPVDGVGDEAFAADTGQAGHILYFRKGDTYVKVDVFAARGPLKDLDAEKQVAQYVLQKL